MSYVFQRITLFGRPRQLTPVFQETLTTLIEVLMRNGLKISLEEQTAAYTQNEKLPEISLNKLKGHCDLMIVIGGDGSFLSAARLAAKQHIPVLGINRGRLGFLTDILPSELEERIQDILNGKYIEESRFLLEATLETDEPTFLGTALNDVVLLPGNRAHMTEFAVTINQQAMCTQRADGLIIATPTGSTAYALSAGGPILHPSLDAIAVVPMLPHTLSSRPIVVNGNSQIRVTIAPDVLSSPFVTCDGHRQHPIEPGASFIVEKQSEALRLLHPYHYNYYETLRSKLHWESNLPVYPNR